MNENEDYLESLLKAAANNDNPDSAISRVREISKNVAVKEEPEVADINSGVSDENSSDLADLLSSRESTDSYEAIAEPIEQAEESDLGTELGDFSSNTVQNEPELDSVTNLNVDNSTDIVNKDDTISSEDISALLDIEEQNDSIEPLEASSDNSVEVEEVDIDSLLSDDPGVVSDFPSDDELNAVSNISENVESIEETNSENIDIDSLLSSDFSGEIELSEEDALALENGSETISSDALTESADLLDEDVGADFNMSEIESLISEENSIETLDESSDSVTDMSEEDISKMLDAASSIDEANQDGEVAIDLEDMASLENEFGIFEKNDISQGEADESGELQEISSLLDSIDSNEVVQDNDDEMLNLLNEAVAKSVEEDELEAVLKSENEEAEAESEAEAGGKKKNKKKRKKKEKSGAVDEELKEKSKFAKFFEYITASDEDEEESLINAVDADAVEGNENVPDGENKDILNEIDSEEENKGGKKGKKKKDKKGKKGKKGKGDAEGDSDESEDGDSEEGDGKKGKKAKKEKKPRKPLELDIDTGKPLNKKNVILIFVLSLSVMACIIIFVKLVPPMMAKKEARDAFFRGEYETTYTTFFGEKKLKEADQVLFDRSSIILKIRHKYEAFEAYRKIGMEVEALDQLLQGIEDHDAWLQFAITCGAEAQFNEEYAKLLDALMKYYNLSESAAREIIVLPTNLEYSLMVESVVKGTPYIDPNAPLPGEYTPSEEETTTPAMQDVLREEGM